MQRFAKLHVRRLFTKLAIDLSLDKFTVNYCLKRFSREGLAFFTVTLPKLAKAVLQSLEGGVFQRPTAFEWQGRSLKIFRGALSRIFDKNGRVRGNACPIAIYTIRQVCEYFYKLALPFSDVQLRQAESKYRSNEETISKFHADKVWLARLRAFLETNYSSVFKAHTSDIFSSSRPRFGPGSFSGSTSLDVPFYVYKGRPTSVVGLTRRDLHAHAGYFKSYPSSKETLRFVDEDKVCEVLFVPKDSRGPRVISKEPMHLLKAQLGFFDWITRTLEECTHGCIQFRMQEKNQELAALASKTREYATLDLKDASDRVSFRLMKALFSNAPGVREFLVKWRSTEAVMPLTKERLKLHKLSGMGSGLTFPLMALLIHSSIACYVTRRTGLSPKEVMSHIHVYGDDVIVPRHWYDDAIFALELSGLAVNKEKSFVNGYFRESCGADYYAGECVNIARLKLPNAKPLYCDGFITVKGDIGILELERHARETFSEGLTRVTNYFYEVIESALGTGLPAICSKESPVLGRMDWRTVSTDEPVRAFVPVPVTVEDRHACAYKYLGGKLKRTSHNHLDYLLDKGLSASFGSVSVPRNVRLKRRRVYGVERR